MLIVSQANMAVDNAIDRLRHPSLYPVRIIRKDYEPEDGDSLPIEENIDSFYQNRIVRNLSREMASETIEKSVLESFLEKDIYNDEFIKIIGKLNIKISNTLDLSNEDDRDDFKRILHNKENIMILENRLEELNEKIHFQKLQESYIEDLNNDSEDILEEKNYLSDSYMQNVNIWGATLFETGKRSF